MGRLLWARLALTLTLALLVSPAWAQKTDPGPAPIPVAIDPPPAPPTPNILMNPVWVEQPGAQDFMHYYPPQAIEAGVEGRVILDCIVDDAGRLSCAVVSEEPAGYGFGEATLRLSRAFRMAPQTRDGVATAGGRVRRVIRWNLQ